jgi:hypothetical protein
MVVGRRSSLLWIARRLRVFPAPHLGWQASVNEQAGAVSEASFAHVDVLLWRALPCPKKHTGDALPHAWLDPG